MTTITIDRATVEQALEALEKYRKMMFVEAGCRFGEGDAAITNLRAALAQQAEPLNLSDPAIQKRLASQWGYVPAAAQAEPVEPVYKVKVTSRWHDTEPLAPAFSLPDGEHLLYTASPQRKSLTEEEIERIGMKHVTLREVIRAVERAHGIKEN